LISLIAAKQLELTPLAEQLLSDFSQQEGHNSQLRSPNQSLRYQKLRHIPHPTKLQLPQQQL
jgi:hypothetical protein